MGKKRIGIIGGGITGLTVAYQILKKGHHVTIFEKSQLGGLIGSIKIGKSYLESFYQTPQVFL